eukprot:2693521-Rhodomonas_salina.3
MRLRFRERERARVGGSTSTVGVPHTQVRQTQKFPLHAEIKHKRFVPAARCRASDSRGQNLIEYRVSEYRVSEHRVWVSAFRFQSLAFRAERQQRQQAGTPQNQIQETAFLVQRVLQFGFLYLNLGCTWRSTPTMLRTICSRHTCCVSAAARRVWGLGSRDWGLGSRVWDLGSRVQGLWSGVEGLGWRVQGVGSGGLGSRVQGLGSMVYGLESMVWGLWSGVYGLGSGI